MEAKRLEEETGPVSVLEQIEVILRTYDCLQEGGRSRVGEELWQWYETRRAEEAARAADLTVFRGRAVRLLSDALRRQGLKPGEITEGALAALGRTVEGLDAGAVAGGDVGLEAELQAELAELGELVAVRRGLSWASVVEARTGRR